MHTMCRRSWVESRRRTPRLSRWVLKDCELIFIANLWVNDGGMDRRITELACHIRQTYTPAPPKRTIACVVAGRNGYKISSTLGCFRASLQTRSRVPRALDYSGPALAGSGTASGVMLAKPGTTAGPGTPLSTSSRVA